jgi:hypothetical protein
MNYHIVSPHVTYLVETQTDRSFRIAYVHDPNNESPTHFLTIVHEGHGYDRLMVLGQSSLLLTWTDGTCVYVADRIYTFKTTDILSQLVKNKTTQHTIAIGEKNIYLLDCMLYTLKNSVMDVMTNDLDSPEFIYTELEITTIHSGVAPQNPKASIVYDGDGVDTPIRSEEENQQVIKTIISGSLEDIMTLYAQGAIITGQQYYDAMNHDHEKTMQNTEVIKFLLDHRLVGVQQIMYDASLVGSLELLKHAHLKGGDIENYKVCLYAFRKPDTQINPCLEYILTYNRLKGNLTDQDLLKLLRNELIPTEMYHRLLSQHNNNKNRYLLGVLVVGLVSLVVWWVFT